MGANRRSLLPPLRYCVPPRRLISSQYYLPLYPPTPLGLAAWPGAARASRRRGQRSVAGCGGGRGHHSATAAGGGGCCSSPGGRREHHSATAAGARGCCSSPGGADGAWGLCCLVGGVKWPWLRARRQRQMGRCCGSNVKPPPPSFHLPSGCDLPPLLAPNFDCDRTEWSGL